MYLPYSTYDSRSRTDYAGQRGTAYDETDAGPGASSMAARRRDPDGAEDALAAGSGTVRRDFNDVLVLGSRTLPAPVTDRLEPWDLLGLRPYGAGVPDRLPERSVPGGPRARASRIAQGDRCACRSRSDVAGDIGGDMQRIERMEIRHLEPTFKHVLLPAWLGAFRYGGKVYRLCVNGRTGAVQGERPYSAWKILGASLLALVIGLAIAYVLARSNLG